MSNQTKEIVEQVKEYCAQIGRNSLLVQGPGGNISWKDKGTLWIKASGAWLADAEKNEIFVPVDYFSLRAAIDNGNFSIIPKVIGDSTLRPSIETMLHALMPHKVVLHLHVVEILAHLVRQNPQQAFENLIGDSVNWTFVDYFKPGEKLAEAVQIALQKVPEADVVLLKNHGVVIGGKNIDDIRIILTKLVSCLRNPIAILPSVGARNNVFPQLQTDSYKLCRDLELNQLATHPQLSSRLEKAWVLYPDHAVFLGPKPTILKYFEELEDLELLLENKPAFIFMLNVGIYEIKTVSLAERAQLRCYYDVLTRQSLSHKLEVLTPASVDDLINWDAEQYRKSSVGYQKITN